MYDMIQYAPFKPSETGIGFGACRGLILEEFVFQSFDPLIRAGFGENSLGRLQVIECRRL